MLVAEGDQRRRALQNREALQGRDTDNDQPLTCSVLVHYRTRKHPSERVHSRAGTNDTHSCGSLTGRISVHRYLKTSVKLSVHLDKGL